LCALRTFGGGFDIRPNSAFSFMRKSFFLLIFSFCL
jgi:hypothetical protein